MPTKLSPMDMISTINKANSATSSQKMKLKEKDFKPKPDHPPPPPLAPKPPNPPPTSKSIHTTKKIKLPSSTIAKFEKMLGGTTTNISHKPPPSPTLMKPTKNEQPPPPTPPSQPKPKKPTMKKDQKPPKNILKNKIPTPASIRKKNKTEIEDKKQVKLKKMGENLRSWLKKPDVKSMVKKFEETEPEETLLRDLTVKTDHTVYKVDYSGHDTRGGTVTVARDENGGQLSNI